MPSGPNVANAPNQPLLIYDGDCRFCCFWVERWKNWTAGQVVFEPSQNEELVAKFPEIPKEAYDEAVQLILPDGRVLSGAAAVAESLAGRFPLVRNVFESVPGLSAVSEWTYSRVAKNRGICSTIWRIFYGSHPEVPSYGLTSWLILRGLSLVYLIAFASLWSQILPLSGSEGIAPIANQMPGMEKMLMPLSFPEKFWRVPTLFWFGYSDGMLSGVCAVGCVLSVLAFLGIGTRLCLVGMWLAYLSFFHVCSPWLSFQWDILLLEAGVIGIFLARSGWLENPLRPKAPAFVPLLLMRWLVFRLMFASGMVKLLSKDETWWNLTALSVHYETQPLPNPIAWHLHNLPLWFHKVSCGIMFGIELVLPFFIFLPRRLRLIACGATIALMVVIVISGNYTFFNLLTIVICLSLLDDRAVAALLPKRLIERISTAPVLLDNRDAHLRFWLRTGATAAFAGVTLLISSVHMLPLIGVGVPDSMLRAARPVQQFVLVNGYGLFANMTERRPEIVLEGSNDGVTWQAYEMPHKPGDPSRRPSVVAPHQPRLDWQMWFAALGSPPQNRWLEGVVVGLLKGNEGILSLFSRNPFPDDPPRFVRGAFYDYRFTSREERRETGDWWKRESLGFYFSPVSYRADPPKSE